MKSKWTAGLDEQSKEDIIASYRSSKVFRDRLAVMLLEKSSSCERASMALTEYDNPSWAFKQADAQGYKRALAEIISLINEK